MRDISKNTGITLSGVKYHLDILVELGFIKHNPHKARGLILTEQEEQLDRDRIPLLGIIAAGSPIPDPVGPPEEYIHVASLLLPERPENLFALRVQGNSMIDALVHDGNYVILRHQETALPGQMLAAWIASKGETTLKHFNPDGPKVFLVSDNSDVKPIVVDTDDLQIKGVVVFVMRCFPDKKDILSRRDQTHTPANIPAKADSLV